MLQEGRPLTTPLYQEKASLAASGGPADTISHPSLFRNSTLPGPLSRLLPIVPFSTVTDMPDDDISDSVTSTPYEDESAPLTSSAVTNSLVITFGCISIFVTIINIVLLVASKYASGGRTPVLIFIRCLCMADALTGVFGMAKMSQVFTRWQWINCFLPESILFSATIAFNLTHVMLTTMCYSLLKDLLRFDRKQDKHRSIFSMTFLWNGSFIIGFAPHMGWNVEERMGWNSSDHICLFLKYFSQDYINFVAVFIGVCLLWLIILNIALQVLITYHRVRDPSHITLTWPVIRATRVDIVLQLLCYIPGALYLYLPCSSCAYYTNPLVANTNLWLFMPLMVFRAMCSTALHVTRSPQIRDVLAHSVKSAQYQLRMTFGLQVQTERHLRPRNSVFVIATEQKEASPGTSSCQRHELYKYSWRQVLFDKFQTSTHRHLARGDRDGGARGLRQPQPTIPEEPPPGTANSLHTGRLQAGVSNQSFSNSNVTLVSSLGSSMQSGTNTNGTVSPKSSISSSKGTSSLFLLSPRGAAGSSSLPMSHSAPSHLLDEQESPIDTPDTMTTGNNGYRGYWSGSMPRRTSQPLLSPIEKATQSLDQSQRGGTRSLLAHQRHLLWAKSPLATRTEQSTLHTSPWRPAQKEGLNNGSRPKDGVKRTSSNTVESEVVVHVSADSESDGS